MCINFNNNYYNSNKNFNYFTFIIIKMILNYSIDKFLFCKPGFFYIFLKFESNGTLINFNSVLYKYIFIFYYSKKISNFLALFNLLNIGFKNKNA